MQLTPRAPNLQDSGFFLQWKWINRSPFHGFNHLFECLLHDPTTLFLGCKASFWLPDSWMCSQFVQLCVSRQFTIFPCKLLLSLWLLSLFRALPTSHTPRLDTMGHLCFFSFPCSLHIQFLQLWCLPNTSLWHEFRPFCISLLIDLSA